MIFPWYEEIDSESNVLNQGDLIKACPILTPPQSIIKQGDQFDVKVVNYNVVVMSQSCDLVNKKIENVLVCSYIDFRTFSERLPVDDRNRKGYARAFKSIRDGLQPNFHLLDKNVDKGINDFLVVEFKNVFGVHFDYLTSHISDPAHSKRLRLLSPYREQLSQAFAKFFMRVGLPQDIPMIDGNEYVKA